MKKRKQKISDPIPVDLLIDIFSRVPTKSIARFRCISKFWASIIVRQDFTEVFLTKSSTRPRLLFTFKVNGEYFVFSTPQPQNLDTNLSLVATRYKNFPRHILTQISWTFCERGLVFLQNYGRKVTAADDNGKPYFGYDSFNKQFKVFLRYGKPNTHRVLTLEDGKLLRRRIQDPIFPHSFTWIFSDETCINGVLYYGAKLEDSSVIVRFNFRDEKFSFINIDKDVLDEMSYEGLSWTLFNYKGKLGAHLFAYNGEEKFVLWVLEDAEKHKWSKVICVIPYLWREIVKDHKIIGMTSTTNEIVFSPYFLSSPFYLFFYNIEMNTFTSVNIQGFEEFKREYTSIHTFLDYVENMKVM